MATATAKAKTYDSVKDELEALHQKRADLKARFDTATINGDTKPPVREWYAELRKLDEEIAGVQADLARFAQVEAGRQREAAARLHADLRRKEDAMFEQSRAIAEQLTDCVYTLTDSVQQLTQLRLAHAGVRAQIEDAALAAGLPPRPAGDVEGGTGFTGKFLGDVKAIARELENHPFKPQRRDSAQAA